MSQHVIDFPCILDTWIDDHNPNTVHGSDATVQGRNYQSGAYFSIMMLKFDHSSLPANKRVVNVKLRFYTAAGFSSGDIYFTSLSDPWTENSTWNNGGSTVYNHGFSKAAGAVGYASGYYQELSLSTWYATNSSVVSYGLAMYSSNGTDNALIIQSRHAANPPMLRVTYEDVPPDAPTLHDPIGDYKDNKSVIRFEWTHNSSVGGTQKKFDLQWCIDGISWDHTVSQTTSNNYYDMAANTFPSGNIYWRVRTYNDYDEAGSYSSSASFYAIGAPNAPSTLAITSGTARPVVTWTSVGQQIYQLQVLQGSTVIYDTGDVPSINVREHKITSFLLDGSYIVQVRIKNEYDMWSPWASPAFTVSTAKPAKPYLSVMRAHYGLSLALANLSSYGLIYRSEYDRNEYICIGKTTSAVFNDHAVKNKTEYKYFVRSVSANDTYQDSDIKIGTADFRYSLISPVTDPENIYEFNRSLNAIPRRGFDKALGGSFVQYSGREHPVYEPTEAVSTAMSFVFFLKTWKQVEDFMEIYDLKGTVLYRDIKGRKVYGILGGLSVADDRSGYNVSFTLTEVDYIEEVEV